MPCARTLYGVAFVALILLPVVPACGQTVGARAADTSSEWGAIIVPQGASSGIYAGASFGLGAFKANENVTLSSSAISGSFSTSGSSSNGPDSSFLSSDGFSNSNFQNGTGIASSDRQWGALGDVFLGYSAVLPNRLVLGLQGEGTLSRTNVRLAGSSASTQIGGFSSTSNSSSSFNSGGNLSTSTSNGLSTTSSSGTLISNLTDQITSEWMVSALARAGYLIDPVDMIYLIGGYTYGRFSSPAQVGIGSFQFGMNGATIGGGWERRLSPAWTLRAEYRYTEFRGHDDQIVAFTSTNPSTSTSASRFTSTSNFTCNACIPPSTTTTTSISSGAGFNTGTTSSASPSSFSAQVRASLQTVRLGVVHYFSTY